MAISKKPVSKTSRKSKPKPRSRAVAENTQEQTPNKWDAVSMDIMGVIIISVSIFFILSMFTDNMTGGAGRVIKTAFVGLFGLSSYVFPFIVIFICLYVIISADKYLSSMKLVSCFVLFIVISVFAHTASLDGEPQYAAAGAYIYNNFTQGSARNGGLAGAILGDFFVSVLSKAGTYILLSATALVCFIEITGKSFFRLLASLIRIIMNFFSAKEYDDEYDEPIVIPKKEMPIETPPVAPVARKSKAARKREPEPEFNNTIQFPSDYTFDMKKKDAKPIEPGLEPAATECAEEHEKKQTEETPPKPRIHLIGEGRPVNKDALLADIAKEEAKEKSVSEKLTLTKKPSPLTEDMVTDAPFDIDPPSETETTYNTYNEENDEEDEYIGDIKVVSVSEYDDSITNSADGEVPGEEFSQPDSDNNRPYYIPPSFDLLKSNDIPNVNTSKSLILDNSRKLEEALRSFRVTAKVIEVSVGPTVTRYELSPGVGVKVSAISNLADDLALNLAAESVRIEAPIPGKAAVGIEIPNKEAQPVFLREVISDPKFTAFPSKLAFALGKDIAGNVIIADIARMPHMLIAGSTGSGKSVCINTLITSIIYKASPDEVKLLMVDPKVVELKVYNGIPHLLIPVVTDPKKAAGALNWAVREMTNRYDLFAEANVRDLKGYNLFLTENGTAALPQIVIIIDELSDLMMTAGKEIEEYICRLAQMARAAGIHLIIATQRPSVDVITGLIKANIPSKIAFAVSSSIDSRTIIGEGGAEKLLGRGDMLFYPAGMSKPLRVQGSFVSDKEVEAIVSFIKQNTTVEYDEQMIQNITTPPASRSVEDGFGDEDEFIEPSIKFVVGKEKASASMLQRQFRIGYNRASRIIEILEERGIVGPEDGSKPRKVLMTKFEWEDYNDRRNM